jgi:hypothetical protein
MLLSGFLRREIFSCAALKASFRKYVFAKPESFRMESFRKNLSEGIFWKICLSKTGIFQKESFGKNLSKKTFRNNYLSQLLGHKVVSERFLLKDSF